MVALVALMLPSLEAFAQAPPNAKVLESRLWAPCCYAGTLDTHESDLAHNLRIEIEDRIAHGESVEAIQSDFVDRFGEKVLAARSDAPARTTGALVIALMVLCAAGLGIMLRRWTRRTTTEPLATEGTSQPTARDELDLRIDAELADLDR